ncbi:MAG: transporter substrate-binding domain-containing protein [Desulfovibrio aminophilus]|jgi:Signal transduction histidine kinase|uniref:transporter substrate-binding domain-containing protein n=1 Tax=Desulfovibrio aminophilus TaxID=81425 RepID=UPI0039E8DA18
MKTADGGKKDGGARILFRVCAVLLILLSCAGNARARQDAEKLLVGIFEDQPQIFLDEKGREQGLFVDVLEDIAAKEHIDIQYVYGTWIDLLDKLDRGEIDLLPATYYTKERARKFLFTADYLLMDWGQLWTGDNSSVNSIFDLEGGSLGVVRGNAFTQPFLGLLESFRISCTVVEFDEHTALFSELERGTVDAAIVGRYAGFLKGRKDRLKAIPFVFNPCEVRYAAPKDGGEWIIGLLDRHIAAMKADKNSVYYASFNKWFNPKPDWTLPSWFWPTIGGCAAAAALLLSLSVILKRQVTLRTAKLVEANEALTASRDQIRRLIVHQQKELEDERRRFAHQVHDDLGQTMTAIKINLVFLGKFLESPGEKAREKLSLLIDLINGALVSVRSISNDISPKQLDDLGLAATVKWHAMNFSKVVNIPIHFNGTTERFNLTREQRIAIYRIFQEALTNVVRHAAATAVTVQVRRVGQSIELIVEDDGTGFTAEELIKKGSFGVIGMKEKAYALDGELDIDSVRGQGTRVRLLVPIHPEERIA